MNVANLFFRTITMLSMYDATIAPLKRSLNNLAAILKKGEDYAAAKKIEPDVLFNARLFPDMFPLSRQVQIATDMSKGGAARLAGLEVPKYDDNETTFADLHARISKTIAFIDSITPAQLQGSQARDISITVRNTELTFTGQAYLLSWVLPNVHFHVTTAYNILRHNGCELGKPDFLGPRD
jgi:uncharacterized protein